MKNLIYKLIFLFSLIFVLTGCSNSAIKDDFCGVHIDYRYCKCAFHNEYCSDIGMSSSEAETFVYDEYDAWLEQISDKEEYGIIEKDGNLYLKSKPGEVLSIKTSDLPSWARGRIATVGAYIVIVGPPDTIIEGDSNVLLDGLPIARIGDATAHGGTIIEGSEKIFVNGKPVAFIGGKTVDTVVTGTVPNVGGSIVGNVE